MICELRLKLILATFWLLLLVIPAQAAKMVADLSQSTVSITGRFHGTDLLLFGALSDRDGDDIIVIISGPPIDIAQRRKANLAGIWINVDTNIWKNAPSLYQILASRPLSRIASSETLTQLKIGTSNLELRITSEKPEINIPMSSDKKLSSSLARNMAATGLWPTQVGNVSIKNGALFRASVNLPANILSGTYDVRILQFRDGIVLDETSANIYVQKAGISALIYDFAHSYSLLYGLFAVAFAVASGWIAAVAFKRN